MTDLMLSVEIIRNCDCPVSDDQIQIWANAAYRHVYHQNRQKNLAVSVVDEDESQALNREYRDREKPTNVLSFPMDLPDLPPELLEVEPELAAELNILGDLAICAQVVAAEAQAQDKALEAHWAHMVVHGVLHLQGFDHIEDDEAEEMEALEREILAKLGYPDPYL